MRDVRKVFQDIAPKLNLSQPPPIENLPSPIKVKEYLMDNHLRCCVLVVDADRIKYTHGHLPQGSSEYRQLLETAANHVGKIDLRWCVLFCSILTETFQQRLLFLWSTAQVFRHFEIFLHFVSFYFMRSIIIFWWLFSSPIPGRCSLGKTDS